jgi:putative endonuclease
MSASDVPNAAHALGRFGEQRARAFLTARGWTVLAGNYRFGRREVDLIVRRGDLIAFVEVKTRAGDGYGAPEEAVTRLKRREIEIVAQEFLVRHRLGDVDVRFDVIAIVTGGDGRRPRISHIEDAWRPEPSR